MLCRDWSAILKNLRRGNYHPFIHKWWKAYFRLRSHDGVRVVEEDWDYLIILDACRYDIFEDVNWLEGTLEKRISLGSRSPEWLERNFQSYHDDIVYITANPFLWAPDEYHEGFEADIHFHEVIPIDSDHDDKPHTAPGPVVAAAKEANTEFPHKRKIIHFMQPHCPYIGNPKLTWNHDDIDRGDLFQMFTHPRHLDAYRGNLELVLEHVEGLIEELEGRIVISADHGEAFGEKGVMEHPRGIYTKELIEVPWFIIEKGDRPTITTNEINGITF